MNLAIPRNDNKEMVLYIWKIIGLPKISQKDLLFKLSFDLSLFSPGETMDFIKKSIETNMVIEDSEKALELSPDLDKKLKDWQKKRKQEILKNINSNKKQSQLKINFEQDNSSTFNTLLKAFLDKGTLNRAVTVSEESINLIEFDLKAGIINAKIKGTKQNLYNVDINIKTKTLIHNCHDFQTKRSKNKKFCKHLARLFLILKEKNEKFATSFLKEIAENIYQWEFLS